MLTGRDFHAEKRSKNALNKPLSAFPGVPSLKFPLPHKTRALFRSGPKEGSNPFKSTRLLYFFFSALVFLPGFGRVLPVVPPPNLAASGLLVTFSHELFLLSYPHFNKSLTFSGEKAYL